MTDKELWEWYAGQYLDGLTASLGKDENFPYEIIAACVFNMARAMMKERAVRLKKSPIPWEEES
jgi:hypothetical protein